MVRHSSLRQELESLRAEIEQLRKPKAGADAAKPGEAATPLERHMAELNRLVQDMLEEAEDTIAEHPAATVAGALALGIVIGRLTAR